MIRKTVRKTLSHAFHSTQKPFNVSTTGVEKLDTEHMSAIIRTAESKNFPAKEIVLNTLRNTLADYLWTAGNYEKAQTVYKKYTPVNLRQTVCANVYATPYAAYSPGKRKTLLKILRLPHERRLTRQPTPAVTRILSELARYYDLTGEPETAVGFLEKAIEAHNYQTNYSLDDEYFDISGELAALYEATNNRTAAARLIASDRECIGNAHNLMPTYSLVNYLLGGYYRGTLTSESTMLPFFYLGAAINAIQQIGVTSGGSDDMQFSLGISGFQAITTLFVTIDRQLKEAAEYLDSDDFKAYNVDIDLLLGQFTQWIPAIKENMTRLNERFPDI